MVITEASLKGTELSSWATQKLYQPREYGKRLHVLGISASRVVLGEQSLLLGLFWHCLWGAWGTTEQSWRVWPQALPSLLQFMLWHLALERSHGVKVFCPARMLCGESEKGLPTVVIPMPLGLLGCWLHYSSFDKHEEKPNQHRDNMRKTTGASWRNRPLSPESVCSLSTFSIRSPPLALCTMGGVLVWLSRKVAKKPMIIILKYQFCAVFPNAKLCHLVS